MPEAMFGLEGTAWRCSSPFLQSSLPVAGFSLIEAPNMAEALEMVSRSPCAVAHGVVEVWPLQQAP